MQLTPSGPRFCCVSSAPPGAGPRVVGRKAPGLLTHSVPGGRSSTSNVTAAALAGTIDWPPGWSPGKWKGFGHEESSVGVSDGCDRWCHCLGNTITSSRVAGWWGGWGAGLAGGLIAGAVIGGIASSAYAYGPGYGYYGGPGYGYYGSPGYGYYGGYAPSAYYGGYAPAYSYDYAPAYYGGYASSYYAPAYGYRYRRVVRPGYAYYGRRYYRGW
jgi:hypothetical protein